MTRTGIRAMITSRLLSMLLLLAAGAALIAGCGSSSGGGQGGSGGGLAVVRNPVDQSQSRSGAASAVVHSADRVARRDTAAIARYPTGHDTDEENSTGATPPQPCRLVTRAEASAILGHPVRTSTAPQGPTCIYASGGHRATVTLTVESAPLASLRRHARRVSAVHVGRATGLCLRYASTYVIVPLGGGALLQVTGPCSTARSFAARALVRLHR